MNIFKKIFGSKPKLPPVDIANLIKTDIHSHLIPGIDDGSKSLNESIDLIKKFKELGYSKLITTPHIMSDYYRNTPEIIKNGLAVVEEELKKQNIDMRMNAAAEYYLDFEFRESIKEKNFITLPQNYLLMEISYLNEPDSIDETIFELQTSGYKVILAHPERYPFWYNNLGRYESLKDKGVYLQLNINSLTGYYTPGARKTAEKLIDAGWISFIGSDCHGIHHLNFLESVLTDPYLHKLVESGKLLNHTL